MTFHQSIDRRPNTIGRADQIAILEDGRGGRAEVWPGQGFNCYRWRSAAGAELLFATETFFQGDRPSRSGIPVLFPFPNRIRAGRYTWEGKGYQLPTNDPSGKNAIHGFAFNNAWRIVDAGADAGSAWVTGEFQISRDAPASLALWPSDARLRLTYRLRADSLALEATADNPGTTSLPFGLGYHPYFAVKPFGGEETRVMASSSHYYELQDNLPLGPPKQVDAARDLRQGPSLSSLRLDDVLAVQDPPRIAVSHPTGRPVLNAAFSVADFPTLVAFTPPHRHAVCLEPYTCVTDAINLPPDWSGLRVLPPGQRWRGDVLLWLTS